jgi:hypothetical protein
MATDYVFETIQTKTNVDVDDVNDWLEDKNCCCQQRRDKRRLLQEWARKSNSGLITNPERYLLILIEKI